MDRNAGIEYFDSPRDNQTIYDAYVIDCVPEREDLGCLQLITSTSNLEEVRVLFDNALDQMGLSRSRRNAEFLLEHLKALSGRLAIRLTGDKPPTSELIALAVSQANCQQAQESDPCWVSLERGFIVPVDDVRDLLPPLTDKDGDEREVRPDLIYVTTAPRKGLMFRFVEVKYRRDLRAARSPDVLAPYSENRLLLWASAGMNGIRMKSALRSEQFAVPSWPGFCVSMQIRRVGTINRRRGIPSSVTEIDRMIEKGGDYRLDTDRNGDRGWVFCPEYAGTSPLEISPDNWSTKVFLCGPNLLPDLDSRSEMTTSPPESEARQSSEQDAARVSSNISVDHLEAVEGETEDAIDAIPSICFGTDPFTNTEVRWPLTVQGNPHLLIAGLPGMGKTTCLLNLCNQMMAAGIRPIVFSYHQDIDERLGQSADSVRFIDFDGLGFNPLEVVDRGSWMAHLDVAGTMRDIFAAIYPELGDIQAERIRGAIKESFVEAGLGKRQRG